MSVPPSLPPSSLPFPPLPLSPILLSLFFVFVFFFVLLFPLLYFFLPQLAAELFNKMQIPVLEIHSRKSQSSRTKTATKFRDGSSLVLFTSDVSARGMDYPDVSLVIQVGLPSDKAQYIHRLGRTARAGKGGKGVLLLGAFERGFITKSLSDQPYEKRPAMASVENEHHRCFQGMTRVNEKTKSMGYSSWIGFYNSNLRKLQWSQRDLVKEANVFSHDCLGLDEPPALMARTVGKMGLKGVPGLRIEGRNGVPRSDRGGRDRHPRDDE